MSGDGITIHCEGLELAQAQIELAVNTFGGKAAMKKIASAINQSLASGRKAAAKEARRRYTAPFKKLFDNVRVERARGGTLKGAIEISGTRGVSLIHFRARPNTPATHPRQGVTAQARKAGPRRVWRKAGASKPFIMKKVQGGFGVFVRHGKSKFEMLYGPSPIQALQRHEAQEHVASAIEDAFGPLLNAEIDRALAQMGSR